MGKKLLASVLAVLCIASFVAASGASATEDTTPPEFVSLSFSPKEVDVTEGARTVTATAHLTDNLSGVSRVDISLISPGGGAQASRAGFELVEGTSRDGIYRAELTIPRFAASGEWTVGSIQIHDAAGNYGELRSAGLKERGLPYSVQVSSKSDTTPPEIASLSFSPNEVEVGEGGGTVTVSAVVEDGLSGVAGGEIGMIGPGVGTFQRVETGLELTEGNVYGGVYTGHLNFPRFVESGEWKVAYIRFRDAAGNYRELNSTQLKEAGMPYSVQVKEGPVKEEPPVEGSLPQVTELSFEPGEVDVTAGDAAVRVDAHVEAEAGLKQGYVRFRSPSGVTEQMEYFERVSGTEFDGEYEAKVLFPRGAEEGKWHAEVWLGDHAGHESLIGPEGLDGRGLPSSVYVVDRGEGPKEEEPPAEEPPLFPGEIEPTELVFEPAELDTTESKASTNIFVHIVTEAGFAGARVELRSPSGEDTATTPLELESGNEISGDYGSFIKLAQGREAGEWLAELEITDARGRHLLLGPEQLAARGLPY